MHGNFLGLILSVLLIGVGYLLHQLIRKKNESLARKVLHIWVSNWYFIYAYVFETKALAIAGLLAFAFVNFIFEKKFFHSGKGGTVYYPLTLAVLLLLPGSLNVLGCAVLTLGYGDALAAIVGSGVKSAKIPLSDNKTVAGSLAMFLVSSLVVFLFTNLGYGTCLLVGLVAAVVEALTPFDLDNVTVPVVVYLLVYFIC